MNCILAWELRTNIIRFFSKKITYKNVSQTCFQGITSTHEEVIFFVFNKKYNIFVETGHQKLI